jgi:LacI family transcriptional regulator
MRLTARYLSAILVTLTFTGAIPITAEQQMARRVTIKDIARQAGVSPQTVSRAINNKGEISPQTRARVLDIAGRLGYQPNGIARSLATRRTRNIGLVVPDVSNPFFASIARGIQDAAHHAHYNVFLCNTDETIEREISAIHSLEAQRVDGMILSSSRLSEQELLHLADRYQPLVLVNRRIDHQQVGYVLVDDAMGMQEAVRYLLELGHRSIGLLAGPPASHSGHERVRGYQNALHEKGIAPQPAWQIHCPPQVEGGQHAAAELLHRAPELTALLSYNDLVAIGALRACADAGCRVPQDCSVVGCDDVMLAALVSPALTTLHIPTYDLGQQAMAVLLGMIQDQNGQPKSIMVTPHLVIRNSSGEPGKPIDDKEH